MNFAFDSVKDKSNAQPAGFCFDVETPGGHFFAVLDFGPHYYANLGVSLKRKLETIASSFTSLENFSVDLFLGFMAKEINNFVHNLAKQSGGPELLCSCALTLIEGKKLSYLLCGDTRISLLKNDSFSPLDDNAPQTAQLGASHLDTPLTGAIRNRTLNEEDVLLVMTRGVADAIAGEVLPPDSVNFLAPDTRLICETLLNVGPTTGADRTLVVITGPYEQPSGIVEISDSSGLAELKQSVALLESRLSTLAESQTRSDLSNDFLKQTIDERIEQKLGGQVAELKEHLTNKPGTIDFLELDEKVKNLGNTLGSKAETAELLELRRDVFKLGLEVKEAAASSSRDTTGNEVVAKEESHRQSRQPASLLVNALAVLVIALGAGFLGGWLSSRRAAVRQEVWSVKTAGNEISIWREDAGDSGVVKIKTAQALNPNGEQKFSSFSDVQRYIETISTAAAHPPAESTTNPAGPTDAVAEVTVKPGDSLKKFAQVYNVPEEKLMALNPGIKRWEVVQVGQKILVPAQSSPSVSPPASPSPDQSATTAATTEVTVGPGDSLNELARRFNTTAARLKELNPQMNWPRIQTGQKVIVPAGG